MRIAYFDCYAGASGDMIVGALIDAGADPDRLAAGLAGLKLAGFSIDARRVVKQGFSATKFEVVAEATHRPIDHTEDRAHVDHAGRGASANEHEHGGRRHKHSHAGGAHRHPADILDLIGGADLPSGVKDRACRIFSRLAEAEAKAHGIDVGHVHFHEVGAADAIIDVVGACLAVEQLGVERVIVSPLPPGSGIVDCAHGRMPVPTPATVELLRGVPLAENLNPGELLTPTGAAILTTLADDFAPAAPPGTMLVGVGVGAGSRDGANVPNLLRVFIGEQGSADRDGGGDVVLLETNLDDVDGVTLGHCFDLLLEAGALDVWASPIVMKKNRPAWMLSALCPPEGGVVEACRGVIFRQTGTLGIRHSRLGRSTLARDSVTVQTPYGPIRVKVGRLGGQVVHAQPEYEDCRSAAERTSASLAEVRRAALAAWRGMENENCKMQNEK